MFRRRRMMRPIRRVVAPEVPPLLQRANQLLETGNYAVAAEAYEQLARGALSRGGPRAPMIFLQAGRARLLNNEAKQSFEHIKQGLLMLATSAYWVRFQRAGQLAVQEYKQRELTVEAEAIEKLINSRLPAGFSSQEILETHTKKPVLPTHCPSCGAALRPNEIDWFDEVTAECAYCGNPVRGEV